MFFTWATQFNISHCTRKKYFTLPKKNISPYLKKIFHPAKKIEIFHPAQEKEIFHTAQEKKYFTLPKKIFLTQPTKIFHIAQEEKIFHTAQDKKKYFTLPKKNISHRPRRKNISSCQPAQATFNIFTMGGEKATRVVVLRKDVFWKSFLLTTVFHRDKHCRGSSNL